MAEKRVESYIAEIAVISELLSVVQSTINVAGVGVSYVNLIVFSLLCLPVLGKIKISLNEIFCIFLFLFAVVLKVLCQGVEEYYLKALVVILLIPFYFVLFRRTTFGDIVDACTKYRHLVLLLGLSYVCIWYFWGAYRNASTVTVFLMLILGFKNILGMIPAVLMAAVMKTQFKIWIVLSLGSLLFEHKVMRIIMLFSAGVMAAIFPLVIVSVDLSWIGFSPSEMSSLEERLREVRSFIEVMGSESSFIGVGWPLGQPIVADGLSERGYMHSSYLWFMGALGVPASLAFFAYVFSRSASSKRAFLVKFFLVLSNALTFLMLTNPFSTALMFANDKKTSD